MIGEGNDDQSNPSNVWVGETSHLVLEDEIHNDNYNETSMAQHSVDTSDTGTSFDLLDLMADQPSDSAPTHNFDPFASNAIDQNHLLQPLPPENQDHLLNGTTTTSNNITFASNQTYNDPFHPHHEIKPEDETHMTMTMNEETKDAQNSALPTTVQQNEAVKQDEPDLSEQHTLETLQHDSVDASNTNHLTNDNNAADETLKNDIEKDNVLPIVEDTTVLEQQAPKLTESETTISEDLDADVNITEAQPMSANKSLQIDNIDKTGAASPSHFQYSVMDIAAYQEQTEEIQRLREELENAHATIESLQGEKTLKEQQEESLLLELQTNLQQQMSQRAEAENNVRLAEAKIKQLESAQQTELDQAKAHTELQAQMDVLMEGKAEAEDLVRQLKEQITKLESENEELQSTIQNLEKNVTAILEEVNVKDQEMAKLRHQRDEQHRKEMSLTSRLNEAKKKEADKANLAEQYEEDFKALEEDLESTKRKLQEANAENERLSQELKTVQLDAQQRVQLAEVALADERKLNEGRKAKMKNFIESKSEELRQAKADNESLQSEVAQTNRSLMELNTRWKQLHAQWVQSQTRNRELQRDLNRIKKDSENLHKVGDTLEMKLSKSATETEEHKNKRLAAKHELMSVLRALESEKEISTYLRDSLKFTFTPKALSQQQLLREGLDDFDAQLSKLCRRLGKPVPPTADDAPLRDASDGDDADSQGMSNGGDGHKVDGESARLVTKLENETQRLSQCIMAVLGNIERLHAVLDASGDRTCYTVFSELLSAGLPSSQQEETQSITGREGGLRSIRSHRYGQVPSAASH